MTSTVIIKIGAILLLLLSNVIAFDEPNFESDNYERSHIWSSLLEEWTVNPPSTRQGHVIRLAHRYIPTSNIYISKRIGNISPLSSPQPTHNVNSNGNSYTRISQNGPNEVSETDLYLLGAIEKLVYRVDYIEKRLMKSEQIIYYLMAGNNHPNRKEIEENICLKNFTRIGDNCYLITIEHPGVNWKTANNICRSYGAQLAEFETMNEHKDIVDYLSNHHNLNTYDNFWLGGLNPGLLWIWSSSAHPVSASINLTSIQNSPSMNANGNGASTGKINNSNSSHVNSTNETSSKPSKNVPNDLKIEGTGRCLGLVHSRDNHNYKYYGVECTNRQHFICELPQDRIKKEISRIAKSLFP